MRLAFPLPIRAAASAVLALAGLALAPGTGTASCGDYVQVQTNQPTEEHTPPAPCPCHGPQCSKAPATPAVPVTAPIRITAGSEQPVTTGEAGLPPFHEPGWALSNADSDPPVRLTTSIFHPPRAA